MGEQLININADHERPSDESVREQEMHRNLDRMRMAPYVLGLVQFGGMTRQQAERHVDDMDPKDREAMIQHATPDYPW